MKNIKDDVGYQKAIRRNLYEIAHALLELKALTTFENYSSENDIFVHGESYFSISNRALFNDMISHAIKVLEIDKNDDSSTFWYILNTDSSTMQNLRNYSEEKIKSARELAGRLMHVRVKTHFHLDKEGILDPHKIWDEANIKGKDFSGGLRFLFSLLCELHEKVFNKGFLYHPDDYDETDLIKILNFANSRGLINVTPRAPATSL